MNDQRKTKKELLAEIAHMRQRIAELETKGSEAELIESESRFRALSQASFESTFISEKGICIEQNLTAEQMFGYTLEEAVGRSGTEWIAPEDRELVMNNMLSGYEEPYEVMALRKDGSTFPAEIRGKMMAYNGRSVRVTALNDITKWKQAEAALRKSEEELIKAKEKTEESEEKFRAITNQTTEGITVADLKGNYILVNPAFCKMAGYSSEELLKMTVFDMKAPNQPHTSFYDSKNVMEGLPIQVNLQKKDGTEYLTEIIGKTITIDSKQFVLGTIRDISKRVEAAEEIKKLSKIIETTSQFVVIADIEGSVVYVNAAYVEISGYSQEEVVGGSMFEFSSEEGVIKLQSEVIPALLTAGHWRGEMTVRKKDGIIFPAELICSLLTTESGEPEFFVAVFFDITERVQAAQALQKLNAELDERVRERTAVLNQTVQLMAGREVRMAELKKVIKKLRTQLQDADMKPVANDPLLSS